MTDKLKQILLDCKDAYHQYRGSKSDEDAYSFAQRRFYGYLRALMEYQQNVSNTKEYSICRKTLKFYLSKL